MKKVKSYIKRIPFLGSTLATIKRRFRRGAKPVTGENNKITNHGIFDNIRFDIIGNDNIIEIGTNTLIKNTLIYIRGNNHKLIIKDNCYFKGGELWIEDNDGTILIHENTTIEHAHLAVTEPFSMLEIQRDCMLAKYVEIRTGDSHSIIDKETGRRINKAADVFLAEHVWVGAHAKILKGVNIGSNSVIATASVVTTDVPSFSLAAGVPAKIIRTGIDWNRNRLVD